jgi:hypothetical protein
MIAGCGKSTVKLTSADKSQVVTLGVEVADNPTERARGLMERKALEPEKGMLFVFPEPQVLSFWMKDTLIPLEILFFDQDGQFVNSMLMEPCTQDPCTRYVSQALAQYAIEVLPDFRQKHGVGVGWSLDLKGVRKISRPT